ncbi:nucleoside-diphosphate kinase [Patescibacteria group bacterium]|nr:nucleoside-diphosphate kinase [Patescibacteria group bacterium]HOC96540.1 nucleoside-diphosphate kinase [bacterium]
MNSPTEIDIERTLVLLKPDAVQRGLVGRIIQRFEDVGLKIVATKMIWPTKELAEKHYADLGERRGQDVKDKMVSMLTDLGPIMALVLEGIEAVSEVRMLVGPTEPKSALPGTIRGDFSHVSYKYADAKGIGVKNLIHASSSQEDALKEIALWFKDDEIYSYRSVHDAHILE